MIFKREDPEFRLEKKIESQKLWHSWFAWYPVLISFKDGVETWAWMTRVERKLHNWIDTCEWRWGKRPYDYRLP